ncbi:hypothetical protein ACUW84_003677, partial [Bacillus sp. 153480031-1]
ASVRPEPGSNSPKKYKTEVLLFASLTDYL